MNMLYGHSLPSIYGYIHQSNQKQCQYHEDKCLTNVDIYTQEDKPLLRIVVTMFL